MGKQFDIIYNPTDPRPWDIMDIDGIWQAYDEDMDYKTWAIWEYDEMIVLNNMIIVGVVQR